MVGEPRPYDRDPNGFSRETKIPRGSEQLWEARSRRRVRVAVFWSLLLVVNTTLGGLATADDHKIPKVMLSTGTLKQPGNHVHSHWMSREGRVCYSRDAEAPMTFPTSVKHASGSVATIRLKKRQAPRSVTLTAWRRLNQNGRPAGPSEALAFELNPRVVDGQVVAWNVSFVPSAIRGHYYILFEGTWGDEDGCVQPADPLGSQHADYSFHLRIRAQS